LLPRSVVAVVVDGALWWRRVQLQHLQIACRERGLRNLCAGGKMDLCKCWNLCWVLESVRRRREGGR
jgi:hypothetical protein